MILKRLSFQVDCTREIIEDLDTIAALPPEEASAGVAQLRESVLDRFPEQAVRSYLEIQDLRKKIEELQAVDIEGSFADILAEENDDSIDEELERTNLLNDYQDKIDEIMQKNDLAQYLSVVIPGLDSLSKKIDQQNNVSHELSTAEMRQLGLESGDVTYAEQDSFSTVYVVRDEAWKLGSARGFYKRGSNNVYIKESVYKDPRRGSKTIKHERIHNLLDPFDHLDKVGRIQSLQKGLEIIKKAKSNPEFISLAYGFLERVLSPQYLDSLIDSTQEELLAEFMANEYTAIDTVDTMTYYAIIFDENAPKESMGVKASNLSTAGRDILRTIAVLKNISVAVREAGLLDKADQCDELSTRFEQKISALLSESRRQKLTVNKLGEDAERDRKALMFLLKPSQYRHIGTYLEAKYGRPDFGDI